MPSNETKSYPETITREMLAQWAHLSDEEIARDIAETAREIEVREQQVASRAAFVTFLTRIQAARAEVPSDV